MKKRSSLLVIFGIVWGAAMAASVKPETIPSQFSTFQPILLTFDSAHDRLYAAIPTDSGHASRLAVFSHPKKGGLPPDPLFDLPGICSGLFYDAATRRRCLPQTPTDTSF
jgi:hypothetical protein